MTFRHSFIGVPDLDPEIQDFEDDIDLFKYYPVASLGFSIGF
ncbi:MAG: hypothetical protein V3T28_08645 [Gemmatimonadales bacterium]